MRNTALAFATLFSLACAEMPEGADLTLLDAQGDTRIGGDRIIGGEYFSGLPAVGAIMYWGGDHCTGTLIGPRKVLTAAHCVEDVSASGMTFVLGADANNPDYQFHVQSFEAHPWYDSYELDNDIAYLILTQDAPIEPMPMLSAMDSSFIGEEMLFVGYGVTNGYSQTGSGQKRAVWMSIDKVSATTFRYTDSYHNTCSGDSGGPAFYKAPNGEYYIAGVTSWGDTYCAEYGINTRVDTYLDFLGVNGEAPSSSYTDTSSTTSATSDSCNGETYDGRCDGTNVVWCEGGEVHVSNCSEKSAVCVFDSQNQYYSCGEAAQEEVAEAAPTDPCGGETYDGRCDGDTLIWCENDEIKAASCQAHGASCEWDGAKGFYNCL